MTDVVPGVAVSLVSALADDVDQMLLETAAVAAGGAYTGMSEQFGVTTFWFEGNPTALSVWLADAFEYLPLIDVTCVDAAGQEWNEWTM